MTALARAADVVNDRPNLSSEVLHKDYDRKCSLEIIGDRESQVACRQDELIGCKPPVVK
jgi:hypothetical protein